MAAAPKARNGRPLRIFLIAILIVLHLFAAHGHADVAALEACLVLFVPYLTALIAGQALARATASAAVSIAPMPILYDRVVRRLLPADTGTVMRL